MFDEEGGLGFFLDMLVGSLIRYTITGSNGFWTLKKEKTIATTDGLVRDPRGRCWDRPLNGG